jgi:CheY-like chemotaxis protein
MRVAMMAKLAEAKKRILVVDDDSNTTELTRLILESAGYDCTTVTSGKESLKKLQDNAYDLVLLDVAMPGFSGVDVIESLKQTSFDPGRVVFFTASTATFLEEEGLKKLGVAGCIKKPFTKTDLLQKIQRWLSGKEPA